MGEYYITHSDELYHHGILGQKWGVRRYQTPSGSLTPAGRKRVQQLQKRNAKLSGNIKGRNAKVKAYGESFAKSKRKQKLLIKKAKNQRKAAILKPKNQLARDKALMLNKSPGMIGKHRIKQEYRANKRIGKADKKLMAPEIKKKKAALKNFKDKERIKRNNEQVKYLNTPHEGGSTRRYQRALNVNDSRLNRDYYRGFKLRSSANRYYDMAKNTNNKVVSGPLKYIADKKEAKAHNLIARGDDEWLEADNLMRSARKQGYNVLDEEFGAKRFVSVNPSKSHVNRGTKYTVRKPKKR